MKNRVGAIYSRDRSNSKSHVSSTDKSIDDMFPVNKYQMAATSKSVPSSHVVVTDLAASLVNVTYSVMERKQTAFFPDSSRKKSEQIYEHIMQSIGFGHDSLDNQLPFRNDTFGQPEHQGHSDSLQKYEDFARRPLADKTSRVKQTDNRSKLFRQMSCLQNIFKELNNLKSFQQLQGEVQKIESEFLRMEKNILKSTECNKSSHNFLSEKSSAI